MDKTDQLDQVYEMAVHWADILLIATPIRWGAASSLYYKMVERMNCIQNQITLNNKVLIRNKVAAFIITGGQDGIQAVAGQMMGFFSEIGYLLPQFPVHRALARMGVRGDGAQHGLRAVQRGTARRRTRAGGARVGDVEVPAGAGDRSRQHRARWKKGIAELIVRVQVIHSSMMRGTTLVAGPGRKENPRGTSSISSEFSILSASARASSTSEAAG